MKKRFLYLARLARVAGICLLCYPAVCLLVYLDNPAILQSSGLLLGSFWLECLAVDLFSIGLIFVVTLFAKPVGKDD